ncbi:MAG: hypothetical protein AAF526_14260 [Pseudomonadota bacterium]
MNSDPRWVGRAIAALLARDGIITSVLTGRAPPDPWLTQKDRPINWFATAPISALRGTKTDGWYECMPQSFDDYDGNVALVLAPQAPQSFATVDLLGLRIIGHDRKQLQSARDAAIDIRSRLENSDIDAVDLISELCRSAECLTGGRMKQKSGLHMTIDPLSCAVFENAHASRTHLRAGRLDLSEGPIQIQIPRFGGDEIEIALRFDGSPPPLTGLQLRSADNGRDLIGKLAAESDEIVEFTINCAEQVGLRAVELVLPPAHLGQAQAEFPDPLDLFQTDPFKAQVNL